MSDPSSHGPFRSSGRIKSRALKPRQAALFDTLLPGIQLPDPKAGPLDLAALMPEARAAWLEIGFGGGEHLAEQAARHPDTLMIGCEPFLNGVGSALRHIEEGGLKNVRIHADDARDGERIARDLLDRLIAHDGRHSQQLDLGAAVGEQHCHRVIVAGVAVEDDLLGHASSLGCPHAVARRQEPRTRALRPVFSSHSTVTTR